MRSKLTLSRSIGDISSCGPSICRAGRYLSQSTKPSNASTIKSVTASLSPRWLSDVKQRLGKCIMFGLKAHEMNQVGSILHEIANDWRELVAGSEGYLTDKQRRGIYRREVIWGEMDSMGHVNNVTYNRYAESARIVWAQNYAKHIDPKHQQAWSELWTPKGDGLILRSIKTDFKFPMTWPDHVTVYHKLALKPTPKTDSFVLDVLIMSELHQRPVARCVEDIVVYDYRQGKKTPLRPFMVEAFENTWRLQEESKMLNSERVTSILDRVRSVEQQSWDRPDAVEDLGSASKP